MPFTITPQLDALIAMQVEKLSQRIRERREAPTRTHPFVTVSREFGCEGYPLSESLYRKLNERDGDEWTIWDDELITKVSEDTGLAKELIEALGTEHRTLMGQVLDEFFADRPTDFQLFQALFQTMYNLASNGRVILLGHGGAVAAQRIPRGVHVRIYGSIYFRVRKLMRTRDITAAEATRLAEKSEAERTDFVRRYANADIRDAQRFHLLLNNDVNTPDEMADCVISLLEAKKLLKPFYGKTSSHVVVPA